MKPEGTPMNNKNMTASGPLPRRELLAYAAAFGSTFLARQGLAPGAETASNPTVEQTPQRRIDMKKSINLWALPYPDRWPLKQCFEVCRAAGFDAVEINFGLEGEFSAESSDAQISEIRKLAEQCQIAISGVCTFLYWPYPFTHNDPKRRETSIQIATRMVEVARLLGTENLLVVPGAVYAPWVPDFEPVPNDVCERRAREAIQSILPRAEKSRVYLNIENIFANAFLFSPQEVVQFVDSFGSPYVQVHFDTGNIMQYQFPEHWVPILGKRIKNIHFKEWDKRTHEFNLHTFRTLLDGTTNWPAVISELDKTGYRGYLTFEYFHPFDHYPEALVYQTSDALDRMLGRK
jgi:hexulose-6-phosphate isomerase